MSVGTLLTLGFMGAFAGDGPWSPGATYSSGVGVGPDFFFAARSDAEGAPSTDE